ncbi:hypothetical protein N7520_011331 [Penicillium odoratum]|uniref:uncharacterized protein n=1 Tax=Penicillium odoratum TaxID=1167516 RepID=UPI0025481AA1|nr:uncharacterized protein N7520_011331 [Penicillium odoratum]KAJ5746149.1 hypothetical protein N7520_011331 [Penicillium odoratum]
MVIFNDDTLHQIAALKQLAKLLYDTCETSVLTYHVQSELSQLILVLGLSGKHFIERSENQEFQEQRKLRIYHSILVDLKKLQRSNPEVNSPELVEDVRALINDVIFGLSAMNAHMVVSSQNKLNQMLRDYIVHVATGARDANLVSNVFKDGSFFEKDKAWTNLQQELQDFGITPEQSFQEQDFILTTLRKAALESRLLGNIVPKPEPEIPIPPSPTTFTNSSNTERGSSSEYSETSSEYLEDEDWDNESLLVDDIPISVAVEIEVSNRQVPRRLPGRALDDFPEAREIFSPLDGYDNQMAFRPSVISKPEASWVSGDSADQSPGYSAVPIKLEARGRSASEGNFNRFSLSSIAQVAVKRGKRPNLMSRMKFKMTNNKGELCSLIKMGDVYAIKCALAKGASANTENPLGQTGLIIAASFGHYDVVMLLMDHGAKLDAMGHGGETALSVATLRGYNDIAELLLDRGADPNAASVYGKPALSQAAGTGNLALTKLLLDFGADPNGITASGETALSYAATCDRYQVAQLLLSSGAYVDKTGHAGRTPLLKAVGKGSRRMVELLLDHGADPNRQDSRQQTPLIQAIQLGKSEILALFLKYGYGPDNGSGSALGNLGKMAGDITHRMSLL